MNKHDYIQSPQFKQAVRKIWIKLAIVCILVSSIIGWYFHDIIQTFRTPVFQASVGEFMGVFILVYVAANMILHWLTGGAPKR